MHSENGPDPIPVNKTDSPLVLPKDFCVTMVDPELNKRNPPITELIYAYKFKMDES